MVEAIAVVGLIWAGAVACFMWGDIVKGIRSKKDMSTWSGVPLQPGGVYSVSNGTGTPVMSTNPTGTKTTFKGKVHMEDGAVVENMDVGEGLRLLSFFLQSRHPEIFEEYQAIRKIEKS